MNYTRKDKLLEMFETKIPQHYNTNDIRASQVQMSMEVAAFLHPKQTKRLLLVEAPVGTGKSLGALVPSLIESTTDTFKQLRISYVTATINLQGQLMQSEVPLLQSLKLLRTAILAKGKTHYYCHNQLTSKEIVDNNQEIFDNFQRFFNEGSTGQRDEYESMYGEIPSYIWDRVKLRATKSECERCNLSQKCPTNQQRKSFNMKNHLVITNHEQMIRSVLNRSSDPPTSPIVPIDPGIVIIDEAHHFLDNFLSQIEENISLRELKKLIHDKKFPTQSQKSCKEIILQIEHELRSSSQTVESLQGRYPLTETLKGHFHMFMKRLNEALQQITLQSINAGGYNSSNNQLSDKLEDSLNLIRDLIDEDNFVQWLSYEDFSFSFIPVNFPRDFRKMMDMLISYNKVIVMSGTLTNDGSFASLIAQWRLRTLDVVEKVIPESFVYSKQALIYVPEAVIDPRKQNSHWIEDQVKHLNSLLHITHGRSLILSTSKQHMQDIHAALQSVCDELQVTLLKQDQGGVEKLTELFKKDETSVLLGSGSFFSGFSVPGTSLVSVTFSRLPFPVPDDPYLKLIGQGLEDSFMEDVLFPKMMIQLNQGAGRLIRDILDYGIITILDPRVFTTEYGKLIRSDFERKGYAFTRSIKEVQNFYERKLELGSEANYVPYSQEKISVAAILEEEIVVRKAVEEIEVVKKKSYRKIKTTPEQHDFALKICKERGVTLPAKLKNGEDVYKYLVDLYFQKYESFARVREQFPFKNERQQTELDTYTGEGTQTYHSKKCTDPAFGCSGQCNQDTKDEIRNSIEAAGGELSKLFDGNGHCWLQIKPYHKNDEILMRCASYKNA
ncbi:hypothetical protein ASD24_29620 [Paenibacillus sp. Root52]|uniref:ATP-dependent DNA helicase n=1 Tax=Paenibacillus sp. Root52 TaxID=1736552 RepID=UPI0006F54A98|nr:ATP-dependent DNA helicase [Paenibacillus sp. Root52]KQY83677.1 hypothetical protein ASD24_29620 [Paenibacillus sp. Root52]